MPSCCIRPANLCRRADIVTEQGGELGILAILQKADPEACSQQPDIGHASAKAKAITQSHAHIGRSGAIKHIIGNGTQTRQCGQTIPQRDDGPAATQMREWECGLPRHPVHPCAVNFWDDIILYVWPS
jgi:hypothetical protein